MLHSVNSDVPMRRIEWVNSYMNHNLEDLHEEIVNEVVHLPRAGGKRLRPLVFLLLSESLGREPRGIVPVACSIESLHTSTLVQDDHPDMDGDEMRRGVKTVHEKFGNAEAQFACNILMSKSFSWLGDADIEPESRRKFTEEVDDLIEDLCVGQKLDIKYEGDSDVSEEDYIDMVSLKTASIYETAGRMAAIVSHSRESVTEASSDFGYHLGMGFQMIDDILDLKKSGTGKDTYSDIRNQKSTIVNVHAINNGVPVFDSDIPVEKRVDMIRDCGSVEYGKDLAREHIEKSLHALDRIDSEHESMKVLEQIARISLERTS